MLNALKRSVCMKHIAFYIMDVLEPELIWVKGRCYRFYESTAWKNIHTSAPYMEDKESVCSDEESETNIEIVPHDSKFKHTFYVPKIFYSHIIGTKGVTRRKLENETRTTIDIPKKGKDGNIVITGRERKAIISARHRIDLLIEALKKKIRYTHFLSIPLNKKEIIDKYISFKNDVLEKYNKTTNNIDESLFQTPSKLHLTIGMLKLFDDNDKQHAVDALEECKEHVIDPILEETGSINVQLQGVACMNDDPTDVKVLFAQVTHNEKLQELVDKVAEYFIDIGLMEKEFEKIKLHATLMNTSFKDDYQARFKERYDASEILKVYKDTLFGGTILNQIDISELHTATKDDYYKSIDEKSNQTTPPTTVDDEVQERKEEFRSIAKVRLCNTNLVQRRNCVANFQQILRLEHARIRPRSSRSPPSPPPPGKKPTKKPNDPSGRDTSKHVELS